MQSLDDVPSGTSSAKASLTVARPWSTPRAQHAAGGMLTTIADLMTFARFHLGDGLADDGTSVMSAEALHSMQEQSYSQRPDPSTRVSAGVVRELAGHRVLSHGGDWNGQQALITLVPDRDLAVGSLANSGQARAANDAIAAWALTQHLGSADREPVPIEHDDERLDGLVGRYAVPGTRLRSCAGGIVWGSPIYRQSDRPRATLSSRNSRRLDDRRTHSRARRPVRGRHRRLLHRCRWRGRMGSIGRTRLPA